MKRIFILVISLAIVSCSTYQPPRKDYNIEKTRIFSQSYDEVWGKIIKWFSQNNTPIKNIEKASGLITTEYNLGADNSYDAFDCGKPGDLQKILDVTGNFNIVVEAVDDNTTKVTITCFFNGILETPNFTSSNAPPYRTKLTCESTGSLEKRIFNYIDGAGQAFK